MTKHRVNEVTKAEMAKVAYVPTTPPLVPPSPPISPTEIALSQSCTIRLIQPVIYVNEYGHKTALGNFDYEPSHLRGFDSHGLLLQVQGELIYIGWANVGSINLRKGTPNGEEGQGR